MQRPFIEDCFHITPAYNSDFDLRRKMGIHVEYHIEAEDYVLVTVGNNAPQRIETEGVDLPVSYRIYFICPGCDKRAYKLYLLPDGKEFKCRGCHKLRYKLTGINRKTPHGKMLYTMNRLDKLSKQREKMGTILYNGKYTRKFQSFLRQCDRAGYTKVIEDAAGLMKALKIFERTSF